MKNINKKKIILVLAILILIIMVFVIYFITKKNKSIENDNTNQNEYSIKNPTKKDGISVTDIKVHEIGDQIEVVTTIKNNTSKKLNGLYIEIQLLDKDDNELTVIADNSREVIEAGKSKQIYNYVANTENQNKVAKAEIITLEKNNIDDAMDEKFNELEYDGTNEIEQNISQDIPQGPVQEENQ